ncbi:MAG: phosphoribosylformylglycinamidine synthase [Clostridiales bacterium]|nr:phosphoribosylformylglycinamidine synthase [Clostridiales bacterium]
MSKVRRVYVEKKEAYAVQARELAEEIASYLGISGVTRVRELIRYDVEDISDETYRKALVTVFSEPPVDEVYEEDFPHSGAVFSVEYLPGQFDQRADSAQQCVKLLNESEEPIIRSATTYVIEGDITGDELVRIKHHCINPVDSRETGMEKPETLVQAFDEPADVIIFDGFRTMGEAPLKELFDSLGLAMTFRDFLHIQKYFANEEHRDPTMTEIRVLDTYWSDHCRHTTFSTELTEVDFGEGYYRVPMEGSFEDYKKNFNELYADRPDKFICLMDLALMACKKLKKEGKLNDQEESDEINACSIVVPLTVDGKEEEWLINFKNETHNHPTEIEPFGGAATCLGGAIRDPLAGRTYVYQAMRVTGAADPTIPVDQTLEGKLPQKKIVRSAASGYSSYGNQIGLATGLVKEIYHPNYVAKRMEIGAVMGAAPRRAVQRLSSDPGDIIILLGGRTGRDGCGGATGSSKAHNTASIDTCGAEVQKGNPPTERKIQRLFRREEVAHIIKKCNDFGAGGVSVAIGELADGLRVQLDKVPKKYAGLDGTEIAISESQERMAVLIAPENADQFLAYAAEENLEAVPVAVVTEDPRLVLIWRGKEIVNISRAFLDTNGAHQETKVAVDIPSEDDNYFRKYAIDKVAADIEKNDFRSAWLDTLSDLNVCSQKGLVEMFDSSIGASTVTMPYGGRYQLTETQAMAAKIPVQTGECDAMTLMSYGFDPYLSSWSPYHGAAWAVTQSIAKIAATGGDPKRIRFTFQEYFRRMTEEPHRWSQPFAALLGAYSAQMGFGLPSIGGKDSMSGSFNEIDVPPTLVSFAVDVAHERDIVTPELKAAGDALVVFDIEKDEYDLPVYTAAAKLYDTIYQLAQDKKIKAAYVIEGSGLAAAVSKMAFGNKLGVSISEDVSVEQLFGPGFGNVVAEVAVGDIAAVRAAMKAAGLGDDFYIAGAVTAEPVFSYHSEGAEISSCMSAESDLPAVEVAGDAADVAGSAAAARTPGCPACAKANTCGTVMLFMDDALAAWTGTLEKVFPTKASKDSSELPLKIYDAKDIYICKNRVAKPTVFIPVFPGTNCEYDSGRAFERAGASVVTKVFRNLTEDDIRDSVEVFAKAIDQAQIIMFPGGFSAGDEPEGSAKFFATAFRNAKMKEAVERLLNERDGLVLGVCNGFQALIKLGLVPFGKIVDATVDSPTLTYNTIGRHISRMVCTKVVTNKSPWLAGAALGGVYTNPASHGEGRFVAPADVIEGIFANGQVATQYVNEAGNPTMDEEWNVNGSYMAIEGITSPDGRVLGKMAHVERRGRGVAVNITGEQDMGIFESGVAFFK